MSKLIVEEINANTLKPRTGTNIDIEGFINTGDVYDPRKYGDIGDRTALQLAINACTNGTVYVPPYTWNITDGDLIVPENVNLKVERGAIFNIGNGRTVSISGTIEAGKWQIFAWAGSGAINLRGCKNENCYLQWWGALEGTSNDISAILLKAYQSLDLASYGSPTSRSHNIILSNGFWRIATPFEYVPAAGWTSTSYWLPNLVGEDPYGSVIYTDVGASEDVMTIGGLYGGSSRWIQGTWIKNLTFLGPIGSCYHALNLKCWNSGGGIKDVSLGCGSTSSVVFLSSIENCYWDIKIGPGNNKYSTADGFNHNYTGVEVTSVTGVGYSEGAGTYNYFKIHKTFTANEIYALKLSDSWEVTVDSSTMEACGGGEIQSYYTNGTYPYLPLYPGGTTKVGHTFTLDETTTINGIHFGVQRTGSPTGTLTMSVYNTSGGAPTGSPIYTSWNKENAITINGGQAYTYYFPTAKLSLVAGTYFAAIEFNSGTGDSSNYIGASEGWYGFYTGENPSTCYTWNGTSWVPETFNVSHAINYGATVCIYNSSRIKINRTHYESANPGFIIDNSKDIEIEGPGGSAIITRSKNISFTGGGTLYSIYVDPYSWISLGDTYCDPRPNGLKIYGHANYNGTIYNWNKVLPPNIEGTGTKNLFHNTSLARWRSTPSILPDGLTKSATQIWEKCGTGQSDTTHHPLAPYCAKLTESKTTMDQFYLSLTGDLLSLCKGHWVCFSIYAMVPTGTVFTTNPNFSCSGTYPAWAPSTQYNIGDQIGTAICVEPGVSGLTVPSPWPTYSSLNYTVDGTVVWLSFPTGGAFQLYPLHINDEWNRYSVVSYIARNTTSFNFQVQCYSQATTDSIIYFALPQINLGVMPGIAPDFPSIAYFHPAKPLIVNGLFLSQDSYIPSNSSSKLYGQYAIKGDRCKNNGTITTLASGYANEWACTTESTTGTWTEVSRVP